MRGSRLLQVDGWCNIGSQWNPLLKNGFRPTIPRYLGMATVGQAQPPEVPTTE